MCTSVRTFKAEVARYQRCLIGGAHWRTSETNQYSVDEQWHVLKHHPSVGLHLLRGELLAYVYLHILIDAMETIQRDGKFHNNYGLIARKHSVIPNTGMSAHNALTS